MNTQPGLSMNVLIRRMTPLTVLAVVFCLTSTVSLAAPAKNKTATKAKTGKQSDVAKPQDLQLQTGDGIELAATYYAGGNGKQTIPVVLLHGWKQGRNDLKDLARSLQAKGCAVLVPDLRGHGDSTRPKDAGKNEKLEAAKMAPQQFSLMVTEDMMAVRNFLWDKNNAGELNIDKLCIVGAEMGAAVALNFAYADAVAQDENPIRRPEYQIGRFVKALVLISPERGFKGLPTRAATAYPAVHRDIAVLIFVGKQDSKAAGEAKLIHDLFKRSHPDPTGDDKNQKKTLFFGRLDTSLQGIKLLDPKFNVPAIIGEFIDRRLVKSDESKDWVWKERKRPHE